MNDSRKPGLLLLALTALLSACGGSGGTSDTAAPTVSLTASPTTVTAAGDVTLTATASDNVGVTRVDFYRGGDLLASDTSSPYSYTDSVTSANNGTLSYTARATDTAGNSATSSAVTVTVTVPAAVCAQSVIPASVQAAEVVTTTVPAPDWTAPHVAGRVLVLNADGTLGAQGLNALSAVRTQRLTGGLTLAETPAGEGDRAFAGRLSAAGLRVQPDFLYPALATPNDPGYPGNAGIGDGTTTSFQSYLTRIGAAGAWTFLAACGKTPTAALTAVLDTGSDGTHEDLGARLLTGRSYTGTAATTDEDGHGTATAGLIGASTNNGVGLAGVTWSGQNLLPVKVLGASGGSTSTIAQGINYAVSQGARVINMSFGIVGNPGDAALESAINTAAGSAVLVAAAGNTSSDGVYYPASNANVIAVGAVGANDGALACYSARPNATLTRGLDLVAPGGAGSGVCPGATASQDMLVLAPGDSYALSAGTSEATPLVSGVAALMRAANPNLSAAQTRALLIGSADTSAGLPLLDAEAAVRAATR